MRILISSCLLGCKCRHDGKIQKDNEIYKLIDDNYIVPFCPEQAGGLSTPRNPCEILNNKVIDSNNRDYTEQFMKGAKEALKLCNLFNIEYAILKSKSPSCGYGLIYDGSFSGGLVEGNGLTSQLLNDHKIKIYNELNYKNILK